MSLVRKQATQEETNVPIVEKKRFWSKGKVLALLLLAALGAGGAACWKLFFQEEEKQILTGQTTFGALSSTIEGTGTAIPNESKTYSTVSNSEILEVLVSAGDTVHVGDLLYRQDDSEIDEEIDDYKDQIAEYEDSLVDYYDQLDDIQEEMGNLSVNAALSGHLMEVRVEEGDEVRSGDTLATLVDDTHMTLTQYFSYAYESEIEVGMEAVISLPDLMNSFRGSVTAINKVERVTSTGTKCFAVTVELENPGAMTEGMEGGGYLLTASGEAIYPAIEGTLEYRETTAIKAEASGEITYCGVVDYQRVEAGESLFLIDGESYTKQIKNLNSQITRAEERIESLYERIADSEEKRENYNVYSEIDGTVIMVAIEKGDTPQSGRTAVMIYNLDSMCISVNIDELDIAYVKNGMEVTVVRYGAEENDSWTGVVSEVSLEANNSNGVSTFPVTIEIPSEGALSAGVSVSYYINTGDAEEGVLAPIGAVQYTDEGTCLFVQADSRPENAVDLEDVDLPEGFYAVPVETGTSNNQYIRILSGVEEGETLFLRYAQNAPSGGETTSQGSDSGMSQMGGMPDFSGGMPSFGGGGGGMPGGGGGMPGGMGGRG